MATSTSVETYSPAVLRELGLLLKAIRERQSLSIREMERTYSDLSARVIGRLEKGQGTGRPGQNTINFWRIKQISEVYEIPVFLIEKLLAGQLSADEVINSYRDNSVDNSTLTKQIRIITQSISFADVCRLAKCSQICIQRLADIVEGCQINSWEVEAFSTFFSKAQSTLVTFPESGEDSSDVIRCKVKMTTLADLIKAELERRQMSVEDLAEIIGTDLMSVEQLKELKEGKLADEDQVDLIFRYLVNPKTKKPFKKPDELLQFLINPDWTPKTNNNSSNGFCNHSC